MAQTAEVNGLRPLRCTHCGRFLGLENVRLGRIHLKCPNCKGWVILVGEEEDLTGNSYSARVMLRDGRP